MSNITTQTIRVDLSTDKVIPTAFTHQNDTARTLVFDNINKGQQKQLVKREEIKKLFDRYGVEY